MRVITGSARGRRLETLEGEDVRPTTDRIKEAVFSIIQFETEGRIFLTFLPVRDKWESKLSAAVQNLRFL